ncbi:hypothetical protein [Thiohalobacter sp.]|uniref:hypothetical protein n=1 Tax=Thiohalobacter sp. TaxID=2025948 RepID=UPI0026236AD0|nr:hypothetical protein [Thiohalobacter sp.]
MRILFPILFLLILAGPAAGGELRDEVRALFEARRAIEMESHRARVAILEAADRCIRGAEDFRAYRACEREEAAAREAHREDLKPKLEALRTRWEALRERLQAGRTPGD